MKGLLIITGLGLLAMLAEIFKFKRALLPLVLMVVLLMQRLVSSSTAAVCDPLCGSIPITNIMSSSASAPIGEPRRADLMRD